jgi:hypothetical protein
VSVLFVWARPISHFQYAIRFMLVAGDSESADYFLEGWEDSDGFGPFIENDLSAFHRPYHLFNPEFGRMVRIR